MVRVHSGLPFPLLQSESTERFYVGSTECPPATIPAISKWPGYLFFNVNLRGASTLRYRPYEGGLRRKTWGTNSKALASLTAI
jgi:hypothetical protein